MTKHGVRVSVLNVCDVFIVFIWAILLAAAPVFGQDYVNDEFHFAMTFPPGQGWGAPDIRTASSGTLMKPQRLVLVASRNTGEKVTVQVVDVGDGVSLDDAAYREGFRNGTLKSFPPTLRMASEHVATFAGVPSYELVVGGTIQEVPINLRMVAVVANRLQYNISGYSSQASSLTDGELANVLSTFHFTEPPQLPGSNANLRSAGELAGRLAAYAAMAIVVSLVMWRVFRRRKTT